MTDLSSEQLEAVSQPGHVLITACPGSGKTRVLTARVLRELEELASSNRRVVALTYTNRAADEIKARLDDSHVDLKQLWAGTIHSFALEWVLRPFTGYLSDTRFGFSVADEFYTRRLLRELKEEAGENWFFDVNLRRDRAGATENTSVVADRICRDYRDHLSARRMLDYDDVLYLAYTVLGECPEIASTLAHIISLVCVDEVQDTQDLQYGILSRIATADGPQVSFFFVGDPKQSIYEGLGAVVRTPNEIRTEFAMDSLSCLGLTGNYRSIQRIIEFYRGFHPDAETIEALRSDSGIRGILTFQNQTVPKQELAESIAGFIKEALLEGVDPSDICVVAPQWTHVRALARGLVALLPEVSFDAPGLSPFHSQRENFWFKVARLLLTEPTPSLVRTRARWAGEVIRDLESILGTSLQLPRNRARGLLRIANSIQPDEDDGLRFLDASFSNLMERLQIDINAFTALAESREIFFEKARDVMEATVEELPTDVAFLRKLFKHPSGIVVSTCHGVKGEEYDTVIAFGLLKGFIPHWNTIINGTEAQAASQAARLLYVVCSRAKRRLHLIAESGRRTSRGGYPYETTPQLARLNFDYDALPGG